MSATLRTPLILLIPFLLAGCAAGAAINDAFTPSLEILHEEFDNSTIVRQLPVSASKGIGDSWHTLGFEWSTKTPRTVFVTAGTRGITMVNALAFNADGVMVTAIERASYYTETDKGWSESRFAMSIEDFLKIARAQDVKMRLSQGNDYSVSSFGPAHPNASINTKFQPFTMKILELSERM